MDTPDLTNSGGEGRAADGAVATSDGSGRKLVLVDGHALVYRAYHALPPDLRTSTGEPTNAVLGFTQMLLDTLRIQAPDYIVVTFDKGRTFRHEASSEYKAQRGPMPDDLRDQMGRVRQIVEALGIPIMELAGFEADDLIGTLSKQAEEQGIDTYILTADTDQHQLVSDRVKMIAPGGYKQRFSDARIYDKPAVIERYGFEPTLVPDYKALVGDKTDNIPNVPGIGEKTASALLAQYGSLEEVLAHIDALKPKQQEALREHAEQARQSKVLATIVRDAPVTLDLEQSRSHGFDKDRVLKLLQELEFRSLVGKVNQVEAVLEGRAASHLVAANDAGAAPPEVQDDTAEREEVALAPVRTGAHQMNMFDEPDAATSTTSAPPLEASPEVAKRSTVSAFTGAIESEIAGVPPSVTVVADVEALRAMVERLRQAGRFTFDVEATSPDDNEAELVGIALTPGTPDAVVQEAYYVPTGHISAPDEAGATQAAEGQFSIEQVREVLGPLLLDTSVPKDGHNLKYDIKVLKRAGLPVEGLGHDTMISAYLVGETSIGLKDLAFTKLFVQMVPITELIGKGKTQTTMDTVATEVAAKYAAADVAVTERLRHEFAPRLETDGLLQLFEEVEMPLVPVLADMELTGIAIDITWLQSLSTSMHSKLGELQEQIYAEAKHPFNINSTQQLGQVLFEELQLPGRRRTQKGYSTDREVLDTLRGLHPIVDSIIEYRQLIKLKSTYIDALPLLVRRDTGRVHTSFNQTVAATGRLSSSNPNLQNIPIRTEIGRDVRKAFVADNSSPHRLFPDEESLLLAADYSQIELRLLADMAGEERLINAFEAGQDIHAATAAEIMGIPIAQVDPDSRRLAKTVNFGVLYGMGSYGLARDTGLSTKEASEFIELYWSRYPAVRSFMNRTLQEGREKRYVTTLLGRRRYMPELRSTNAGVRQAGERMAINAPVQGTAADIIKIAMNRLHAEMKQRNMRSKLLLQVHDELLFEAPASELDELSNLVCSTMEGAWQLRVPLVADVKAGKNWGEMHPIPIARAGK
ncbi:MAG: DNA polymerase I [Chloroflexota bacterium]|nr:DNA polymerase I [Chloroflexota bacterium]MDQ5864543.1 DNA polymerase I [Chloroflexota bacterium]